MPYSYRVFDIVFGGAVVNQEFLIDAERIDYQSGTPEITIRLDSTSADAIPLLSKQAIESPFSRFYLSCPTAGTISLMVSKPGRLKIESSQVDIDKIQSVEKTDLMTAGAVSVGVAATLICAAADGRKSVLIQPVGGEIFLGGAAVTIADGFPIAAGVTINLDRFTGDIYGIAAAAVDTRYLIEGV